MTEYLRLCKFLNDYGTLVPKEDLENYLESNDQEYYRSIYTYTEDDYVNFTKTGSVKRFTGLMSDFMVWDFDSEDEPELARKDTLELCARLIAAGIPIDDINICFSGNKGFDVHFRITEKLNKAQYRNLSGKLAEGLKTRDSKIYNENRIMRIPFTRHPKSGLYKLPISLNQLSELTVAQIKELATDLENSYTLNVTAIDLPDNFREYTDVAYQPNIQKNTEAGELDLSRKPKNMPACKYAILNGFFKKGNRHHSLMALAAHFKSIGYPKEVTYRLLKGAYELHERREPESKDDPVTKEHIWNNIIEGGVYSDSWEGKTYSCKDHEFLQEVCPSLKTLGCKIDGDTKSIIQFGELSGKFKDFAINIEKNRVYTGIPELDKEIMLTTSMSVGLLGSPGSGKTSLALNILNHTSRAGIHSLFCSLDMGWNIVYAKLISRLSGLKFEDVLARYKANDKSIEKWDTQISEDFKNVGLTFKSGTSVDDIREYILEYQDRVGEKVKLVVIDYLECLVGPYSDPTANGAYQAAKLKDLATDLEMCVMVLVQPPKSAGDASQPLTSMRQVKGASTLEQNFRAIISIHREGFSPDTPHLDKFATINGLKNTMGPLFSLDLGWNGVKGEVFTLSSDGYEQLDKIRKDKLKKDKTRSDGWD